MTQRLSNDISALFPLQHTQGLIYIGVEPILIHCFLKRSWVLTREVNHGSSCSIDMNIEDSFEAKKKAGTEFINLTATYDTVYHRNLTCKLLRLLPNKHMVGMIMELAETEVSPLLPVTANKAGYAV